MTAPSRKSTGSNPFTSAKRHSKNKEEPFDKVKGKSKLHPRNRHRDRYDLKALSATSSGLSDFIIKNVHGDASIDFSNPMAVTALNKALLQHHYDIKDWNIPEGYLCPPIPGRADYIHHISDVLCASNFGKLPSGEKITCLDIGVGANCVYPLIGVKEYGWNFIGSDIDQMAIESAQKILDANPKIQGKVDLRLQQDPKDLLYGILKKEDRIDLSVCNPPFHASAQAAEEGTLRKLSNLQKKEIKEAKRNFGGKSGELWTQGGERRFIQDLIRESKKFGQSCFWFSTLVSKQSNVKGVLSGIQRAGATKVKTIAMGQGNKSSRIVGWTFLSVEQQDQWRTERWNQSNTEK